MRKTRYKVERRVKKIIFMPAYMVYDVIKMYQVWSGGMYGDWHNVEKRLATFSKIEEAQAMCSSLQENE